MSHFPYLASIGHRNSSGSFGTRTVTQVAAERVLVVAGEVAHDLLEVQAQIVAALVDRLVFETA